MTAESPFRNELRNTVTILIPNTQAGNHDLSDPNLEVQRKMEVLINNVWTVEMKDPNHLAQYCALKSIRELSSCVNVIIPDIVYQAAFVAQNYFLVPQSYFNSHDGGDPSQDQCPSLVYTRDQDAYAHRFPAPEIIGGGTTPAVTGLFSVENLHRAVLLFHYLLKRRSASKWITKTAPQSSSNAELPGYHCPAFPAMNQGPSEIATTPLSYGEPGNSTANPQSDQQTSSVDGDAPEALVDRRARHDQDQHNLDLDKLFNRARETETRVTFSPQGPDIPALMRHGAGCTGDTPPTIVIEECDFQEETAITCYVGKIMPKVWEQSNKPFFLGTLGHAKNVIKRLKDSDVPRSQVEDDTNPDVITMLNVYNMVYNDESCGVHLFYMQNRLDCSVSALGSRGFTIGWLLFQSPIMTRARDLAIKYSQDKKERLLVYVEDSWIQCILVALFVTAEFDVGTVRSSDGTVETDRIIRERNNPRSGLEMIVANHNTNVMHADMQKSCSKALILDWPLEPERLLWTINHMVKNRLNSREPAMVHILKLHWSHHDEIERICCTKWAMQLSKDINLPEWMTGAVREICIFEMVKTAWHQGFNRYTWVVMQDMGRQDYDGRSMTHHDGIAPRLGHVFSITAKLMLNFPEDKEFWVDSEEVLVAGCFRFLRVIDSDFEKGVDRLEEKLSYTPERLKKNCLLAFEHAMGFINHQLEHGYGYGTDDYHERNEQLLFGDEVRARGEVNAWPDDVENQTEERDTGADTDAEADGNEESDKVDETGSKRKANDDDEGNAKKQKTGTA
ncbi:hypothetical protein FPCIR_12719 [Fusarium pseudocircinatum]|uniref:Uncharacterized protein n=1 Tax=Fusarium pseudocircinatum TaxID=56676 RepID=A0A8H5NRK5_9HYPO|nr:hypothetical protein FPCIR_12719 [Fusarium pseudocircinatum]